MTLTLIQRGPRVRNRGSTRVALVLAGGAVSGGAFKVGGLKALDECLVGRGINDLDVYVGLSAGAFLATSLAAGITPDEMIRALEGTSSRLRQLRPVDFYRPNLREIFLRPTLFGARLAGFLPGLLMDALSVLPELPERVGPSLQRLLEEPSYTHFEKLLMELAAEVSPKRRLPPLGALLPSGFFDNSPLRRWLAENMAEAGVPDDFAELYRERGKRLYITATDLDTAERVVFGPENDHGLRISEAVQASSALPGFYRPARFHGVDYVDGGVRRTANIDVAIEQGADLVICYNPFRPFVNPPASGRGRRSRRLADGGLSSVMNQVFRTLLHTRLSLGLQAYLHDRRFQGDILVIEAREADYEFFDINPLIFWRRADAVRHGFESVTQTLRDHSDVLGEILDRHGLEFRLPPDLDTAPVAAEPAAGAPILRLAPERAAG